MATITYYLTSYCTKAAQASIGIFKGNTRQEAEFPLSFKRARSHQGRSISQINRRETPHSTLMEFFLSVPEKHLHTYVLRLWIHREHIHSVRRRPTLADASRAEGGWALTLYLAGVRRNLIPFQLYVYHYLINVRFFCLKLKIALAISASSEKNNLHAAILGLLWPI